MALQDELLTHWQEVTKGQMVAFANKKPAEAFIHFELRRGKRALDPKKHLSK